MSEESESTGGNGSEGPIDRATSPALRAIRLRNADRRRRAAADLPIEGFIEHDVNGDAQFGAVTTYTKGIPPGDDRERDEGVLPTDVFEEFVRGLNDERYGRVRGLTDVDGEAGERPLVNPSAASSFVTVGTDPNNAPIDRERVVGTTDAAPPFGSERTGAEMVELYWQAITRDVRFSDYGDNPRVGEAIDELTNEFDDEAYVGPTDQERAFRGVLPGADQGPHVSQFLYLPIPRGAQIRRQTLQPLGGGDLDTGRFEPSFADDHLDEFDEWLAVQNGVTVKTRDLSRAIQSFNRSFAAPNPFAQERAADERYIVTGRDLATYVRANPSQQPYLAAALILQNNGAPLAPGIPTEEGPLTPSVPGAFVDYGRTEYQTAVVEVINAAIHAAWYRKWLVHRRLRPEEYGGRIEVLRNRDTGAIDDRLGGTMLADLLHDGFQPGGFDAVELVEEATGHALLPQAYRNGSPTHPSYPAGHSTNAGACATVLKAFFDTNARFGVDFEPVFSLDAGRSAADRTASGAVRPVRGTDYPTALEEVRGLTPTVEHEINKLATNMSIGRNWAGIHYRTDATAGYRLGEFVALSYLDGRLDTKAVDGTLSVPTFFDHDEADYGRLELTNIDLEEPTASGERA